MTAEVLVRAHQLGAEALLIEARSLCPATLQDRGQGTARIDGSRAFA
jgi:hypothetical protein